MCMILFHNIYVCIYVCVSRSSASCSKATAIRWPSLYLILVVYSRKYPDFETVYLRYQKYYYITCFHAPIYILTSWCDFGGFLHAYFTTSNKVVGFGPVIYLRPTLILRIYFTENGNGIYLSEREN